MSMSTAVTGFQPGECIILLHRKVTTICLERTLHVDYTIHTGHIHKQLMSHLSRFAIHGLVPAMKTCCLLFTTQSSYSIVKPNSKTA